jgi:hypothetical protein
MAVKCDAAVASVGTACTYVAWEGLCVACDCAQWMEVLRLVCLLISLLFALAIASQHASSDPEPVEPF